MVSAPVFGQTYRLSHEDPDSKKFSFITTTERDIVYNYKSKLRYGAGEVPYLEKMSSSVTAIVIADCRNFLLCFDLPEVTTLDEQNLGREHVTARESQI